MTVAVLSNQERRVIANLSIPRNRLDLERELRMDPFSDLAAGRSVDRLLSDLAQEGFVVSLGAGHESPGKLAAAMDAHQQALDIPDEKAHIFEHRLLVPQRAWRATGEQWVMTHDGFAKLHDHAGVGSPSPMPTAHVERLIAEQAARVHHGPVGDDTLLGSDANDYCVMLEDEFHEWARQVADRHEEATGERPRLPIAGGGGYSDATEVLIIDPENGKGSAYTETAPWYMAAVTVAITDADTGSTITEAAYTGYARKSVAALDMNAAASPGGSATNANAITFANCTGGTAAVIGFGKCVAATAGRLIKFGTCALVNVSSTQQPLSFAAAAFTTSLD